MDGKCAAHMVRRQGGTHAKLHAMDYGMQFPFDDILPKETVYIVDFSIEPDDMTRLLGRTEWVVWIDHHKTAIDKYSEFQWKNSKGELCNAKDIKGIRDTQFSGCELTHKYFVQDLQNIQ